MKNPIEVFSDRVQAYLAYRPGYSTVVLDVLRAECNLRDAAIIADVGSGTGLLSELFLKNGNLVYGIEPNTEMRSAGENRLEAYTHFVSVAARAEATTLKEHSVDFITAGQAYHWFEIDRTKREFARILKSKGWVVLVYNIAREDTPFLSAYQEFCITYLGDKGSEPEEQDIFLPLFGKGNYSEKRVDGVSQRFDFKGLTGRVLSRANAPDDGSPRYSEMMNSLHSIFDQQQQDGEITISYETQVVYGQIPKS